MSTSLEVRLAEIVSNFSLWLRNYNAPKTFLCHPIDRIVRKLDETMREIMALKPDADYTEEEEWHDHCMKKILKALSNALLSFEKDYPRFSYDFYIAQIEGLVPQKWKVEFQKIKKIAEDSS